MSFSRGDASHPPKYGLGMCRVLTPATRARLPSLRLALVCFLVALLSAAPGWAQSIERAPFLQQVTSHSAMVVWKTSSSAICTFEYGRDGAFSESITTDYGIEHVVTLTGLEPATRYDYRVRLNGEVVAGGENFFIRTAPLPGTNARVRVLAIGDSGKGSSDQMKVAAALNAEDAEALIHIGDVIYPGGEPHYWDPRYFEPYAPLLSRVPAWLAPGNHDLVNPEGFIDALHLPTNPVDGSELFYSYDYGDIHFVVLNTDESLTPAILSWLEDDLQSSPLFWKVVYFHHPIWSCGSRHGSSDSRAETLGPIFERTNVDLVVYAHDHHYERTFPMVNDAPVEEWMDPEYVNPSGPLCVLTGGAGEIRDAYSSCDFTAAVAEKLHFTRFTFEGNLLTIEGVDTNRNVFDRATLLKTETPASFLTVRSPNGGETLELGSNAQLNWVSSADVGDVKIELSRSGPNGPWETLAASTTNDGALSWTVSGATSNNCWIRLSAVDGGEPWDVSNAAFTIAEPPTFIDLQAPDGGEIYEVGSSLDVYWSSSPDVGNVRIELSRAGPSGAWETLFASTSNDGHATWTVTGSTSDNCLLRISPEGGGEPLDISEAAFAIVGPAFVEVEFPNGGDVLVISSLIHFKWSTSPGVGDVKIELSRSGSAGPWETLVGATTNDGSKTWYVDGPAADSCLVRISAADDGHPSDRSDTFFTIADATPVLNLMSPTGGESFPIGSSMDIQWSASPSVGEVKIELSRSSASGPWETLAASTTNDGSESWSVAGPTTNTAWVRVSSAIGGLPMDVNDSAFAIVDPAMLELQFPNGGENLTTGTSVLVLWSSSGVGNVRIELSRDGPAGAWEELFASTPDDGSQLWTVSGPASSTCWLRVSALGGEPVDQSDASFAIVEPPPVIELVTPDSGGSFTIGSTLDITWNASPNIDDLTIELSRASASGPWEVLYAATPNDGWEAWTITGPATESAWLRLSPAGGGQVTEVNEIAFALVDPASIDVEFPNGGESLTLGTAVQLRWDSSPGIGDVKLELSRSGPNGPWEVLFASTTNDGSKLWAVSGATSDACWLRVSGVGGEPVGLSDAAFAIVEPPPPLQVLAPNGGESLTIGSSAEIRWTGSPELSAVLVQISRSGATGPWETLFASTTNDGAEAWTVSSPAAGTCWIRVSNVSGGAPIDVSDAAFAIVEPDPFVNLQFPNGGESFTLGSTMNIFWSTSPGIGALKIELSRSGSAGPWETLFSSTSNDGAQTWQVTEPASASCWLRLTPVKGGAAPDQSAAAFAIVEPPAVVDLTSPLGGGSYTIGDPLEITWSTTPDVGDLRLELSRASPDGPWELIHAALPNDGSETWTVSGPASEQCWLRLSAADGGEPWDVNETPFAINDPPFVQIQFPNGGETLTLETTARLTWSASGGIANVRVQLSRDGPSGPWEVLFPSTANDGAKLWTVDGPASDSCWLQISDAVDGDPIDRSDAAFTIAEPPAVIELTSPNGGEQFTLGTALPITWTSSPGVGAVTIQLSRTGAAGPWETLFASTANDGSESWPISGMASDSCWLWIAALDGGEPQDLSDGAFSLLSPAVAEVQYPNGGETLTIGETLNLDWSTSPGVGEMKIELSRAGPDGPWEELFDATANDGRKLWTVSGPASDSCFLRVSAAAGGIPTDRSDAAFRIADPPPVLELTAPDGGESFMIGSSVEIRWSSVAINENIAIELSRSGPAGPWETIIPATANDGVETWTVSGPASNACFVRVSPSSSGSPVDRSAASFEIFDLPPPSDWAHRINFQPADAPVPALFTPDHGDAFDPERGYGWHESIRWAMVERGRLTGDPRDSFVDWINDWSPGIWEILVPSGEYRVSLVCGDPLTSATHRVEIEGQRIVDDVYTSGGNFVEVVDEIIQVTDGRLTLSIGGIGAITHTKLSWIEITPTQNPDFYWIDPVGGEALCKAQPQLLRWNDAGLDGDVRIELSRNGPDGPWETLFESTPNDGEKAWTPAGSPSGNCFLRLVLLSAPLMAVTPGPFTLLAPQIQVQQPGADDIWEVGNEYTVRWSSSCIDSVRLEVSRSGLAGPWTVVRLAAAAADSLRWLVRQEDVGWTHIRLAAHPMGVPAAEQSAPTIVGGEPEVTVLAPNGGETWFIGETQEIQWAANGIDAVQVELLVGQDRWDTIATNIDATAGHFHWLVSSQPGSGRQVRIMSMFEPGAADTSDAHFTIAELPPDSIWKINFQPAGHKPLAGFWSDEGQLYDPERGYGWNEVMLSVKRNMLTNDCRDSFVQVVNTETGVWNLGVPNGVYLVKIVCGDPLTSATHRLALEGQLVVNDVYTIGGTYVVREHEVEVRDGRLTMTIGGNGQITSSKVNCIEVVPLPEEPGTRLPRDRNELAALTLQPNLRTPGGLILGESRLGIELPQPGYTQLRMYDVRGRLVMTVYQGNLAAGIHTFTWRSQNRDGRALPSGVYFLHLEGEGVSARRKFVLLH